MDRGFDPADMAQDLNFCEMPPGSDRRAFMMRSALAISVASLTGRPIAAIAGAARQGAAARSQAQCGQEIQGTGDDHGRGILQGRARPLLLAHHRADADHL